MERLTKYEPCEGGIPLVTVEDEQSALQRLAAYEDAEERGLLVRLPCKVGDTFWWIERLVGDDKPFIRSGQVSEIGISDAITIYEYDGRDFSIEDVYFTREEAESELVDDLDDTERGDNGFGSTGV